MSNWRDEQIRLAHPTVSLDGATLLAIGCGDGRELQKPWFNGVRQLHGIDVDDAALSRARDAIPTATILKSKAESLPYGREYFSHVMSRVALPYADIPVAINEIARVIKPGGYLYLLMHDWRMQWSWFSDAVKGWHWIRAIDHGYIFVASTIYALTGKCFARPWDGTIETYQTKYRIRKQLEDAGFRITRMERRRHLEIEAVFAGSSD